MNQGDEYLGRGDEGNALLAYAAAARLAPQIVEILFWNAVSLANIGNLTEAAPIFKQVFEREPAWREMLVRLVEPGLVKDDPQILEEILKI
jgi:cytochrome c-type biogenesis protein CcmH/NrfG